jgi:hypothetical protein
VKWFIKYGTKVGWIVKWYGKLKWCITSCTRKASNVVFQTFYKSFHYSTWLSSIFSLSFHYSTYFSSIISMSFHYSTYFSSIMSMSFHYSTYFSSVFSKSSLVRRNDNIFVKLKGKLKCENIWKIWKKAKLNSEKIWKTQKKSKNSENIGKKVRENFNLPFNLTNMLSFLRTRLPTISCLYVNHITSNA